MPHTLTAESTEHENREWQEELRADKSKWKTQTKEKTTELKPTNHYIALLPVVMNVKVNFFASYFSVRHTK